MLALVTTSPSGAFAEAQELAHRFGLAAEERGGRTVEELLVDSGGAPVLLLGKLRAELFLAASPGGPPLAFRASLGMAVLRLQRARLGEEDPLVRAAGLRPGDRVIDATLGLGGDALLASWATGTPLFGLEASPLLAAFTQASMLRPGGRGGLGDDARAAGARVEVHRCDHLELLRRLPDRSCEVVLFDPMFRAAGNAGPLFSLVRAEADHGALRAEALHEARRVATRGVLVKDGLPGAELVRLGLQLLPARRLPRFLFGWAEALQPGPR